MLQIIRKAADSIPFRILLFIIVVAFAVWGLKDNVGGGRDASIVTFKSADPITTSEFEREKTQELHKIQRIGGRTLSEDEIKQYGVNQIILDRLVTNTLLKQAVSEYSLDFKPELIADFIRQMPAFQNKDKAFDLEIFKATVRHSGLTEEQYSEDIKQRITQNILVNSFVSSYYVPEILLNNIVNFMAEDRLVDLAYIEINDAKIAAMPNPTTAQIDEFYKSNIEIFTIPEKRSMSYVILNADSVKNKINITKDDIKNFYNENKEDFGKTPLAKAESQIKQILTKQVTEELIVEYAKNLEDEVAGGSNLKEIADKFGLKTQVINDTSAEHLTQHATVSNIAETAFGMSQGEVSYPLELSSPYTMALVEITQITPSAPQEIQDVQTQLVKLWKEDACTNHYAKVMQDFVANTSATNFIAAANKLGLTTKPSYLLKRVALGENTLLPPEMLIAIFDTKIADTSNGQVVSKIYPERGKIWAVKVNKAYNNKASAKDIMTNSGSSIVQKVRESIFVDMLEYLKTQEDVMIKQGAQALN